MNELPGPKTGCRGGDKPLTVKERWTHRIFTNYQQLQKVQFMFLTLPEFFKYFKDMWFYVQRCDAMRWWWSFQRVFSFILQPKCLGLWTTTLNLIHAICIIFISILFKKHQRFIAFKIRAFKMYAFSRGYPPCTVDCAACGSTRLSSTARLFKCIHSSDGDRAETSAIIPSPKKRCTNAGTPCATATATAMPLITAQSKLYPDQQFAAITITPDQQRNSNSNSNK